jgi:hypothetical protein
MHAILRFLICCIFFAIALDADAQALLPTRADDPEAMSGNPALAPFKWMGMLIVQNPVPNKSGLGLCTGEFIAPNVVMTAGHCLRDLPENPTGPWPDVTKATFWLQYQNRSGIPFKILCGEVNPGWAVPGNFSQLNSNDQNNALEQAFEHDYAMLLVDGTSPTGYMPYALDWKGKYDYAVAMGYPADILENTVIQKMPGIIFSADAIPTGYSSNVIGQWSPVTKALEGMSGGAWVAYPDSTEGAGHNVLLAVTSFGPVTNSGAQQLPGGNFAAYLRAVEFNPLLISVLNGCR